MPYIKKERRKALWGESTTDYDNVIRTAGELNYMMTDQIQQYILIHGESYQTYNDILGALEGAKLELYRRQVASYEDLKIKENGDVWPKKTKTKKRS